MKKCKLKTLLFSFSSLLFFLLLGSANSNAQTAKTNRTPRLIRAQVQENNQRQSESQKSVQTESQSQILSPNSNPSQEQPSQPSSQITDPAQAQGASLNSQTASQSNEQQTTGNSETEANNVDNSLPKALPPSESDTLSPEKRKIRDNIQVNWFHPQSYPDLKNKIVRVILAGQTKQGTRIYLKSNEILFLKSATEKIPKKLDAKNLKFLPGLADQRGVFAFEVFLPVGNYQLAVAAVDPEAQTMSAAKVYVLFLNVTLKGVDFGFVEEGNETPFTPQSDYYSFGLGFNYAIFNKEVPAIPSEMRFSSFKFPTVRLGYAKTINPLWRFHASLVASPGETKTGTRIPVDGGTYLWTILNADGIYSKDHWKQEWRDYKIRYSVRGGVQMHSVPFISSISTEDNTQGVSSISYITPVIGGHMDIMSDSEFSYEVFLRVNVPGIYSSSIEMTSPLSFDGSLGARYRKRKTPWSYGLYWYGQWLKYSFSEEDKYFGSKVDGTFDILNSNLEFRMHYHF